MSTRTDPNHHSTSASDLPMGDLNACVSIDMVDPAGACSMLQLDQTELLELARSGGLAAYDLGGQIRFRYRDVASLASRRAIAA